MRFNLRQLLMGVAFVALVTAYVVQSVSYRQLAVKYDRLDERFAIARKMVQHLADITITDEEKGPYKYNVYLTLPEGWPAEIMDQLKDVPAENKKDALGSRLSSLQSPTFRITSTRSSPAPEAVEPVGGGHDER
jgi:hypothetical protein